MLDTNIDTTDTILNSFFLWLWTFDQYVSTVQHQNDEIKENTKGNMTLAFKVPIYSDDKVALWWLLD